MIPIRQLLPIVSQQVYKEGCLCALGCSGEDRLLVGLDDSKLGREILRGNGTGIVGDPQVGAEKDGSKFCDLS